MAEFAKDPSLVRLTTAQQGLAEKALRAMSDYDGHGLAGRYDVFGQFAYNDWDQCDVIMGVGFYPSGSVPLSTNDSGLKVNAQSLKNGTPPLRAVLLGTAVVI